MASIIDIALIYELKSACSLHMQRMNKSFSSNKRGKSRFKTWMAPLNVEISVALVITLFAVAASCITFTAYK